MAKGTKSGVTFAELRALLGRPTTEPVFVAVMERASALGKVVYSRTSSSRRAGFDFALGRPDDAKRNAPKVAETLFMFRDGRDKHRQFGDPPSGFAFTTRGELLAKLPAPVESWKVGKGKVPVETKDVDHDRWIVGGCDISASYRDGEVEHLTASLSAGGSASRSAAWRRRIHRCESSPIRKRARRCSPAWASSTST